MQSFADLMESRRSVRNYTGEPAPDGAVEQIVRTALSGETGRGRESADFIVVEDRGMLQAMSHCRKGSAKMLEHAAAAVVVVGDPGKSDTWIEDCCVAMAHMHLAATDLGLGSCWIQCRMREAEDGTSTEDYLRGLLGFPRERKVEALLSIGVMDQVPEKRGLVPLDDPRVHRERF